MTTVALHPDISDYEHLQDEYPNATIGSSAAMLPGFKDYDEFTLSSTKPMTPFLQRTFSNIKPGSVRGSIFSLASTALGAGILSLPTVFGNSGLCLGIIYVLLGAGLGVFGMQLLIASANRMDISNFSQLVREVLGYKQSKILQLVIVLYAFGCLLAYLIVIKDAFASIFRGLDIQTYPFNDENMTLTFFVAIFAFPLSLLRNLSSLRYASLVSVLAILYVTVAIFIESVHCSESFDNPAKCHLNNWTKANFDSIDLFIIDENVFKSLTLTFFAYTAHTNIFPVFDELSNRNIRRMTKVFKRSVWLELIIYLIFSVSAYLTWHQDADDDILNNYDDDNYLIMAGRITMSLALLIGLPVNITPARNNFNSLFLKINHFHY